MVKIKKEQTNIRQNVWIEIISVLFIVFVLSVNFSSLENFDFLSYKNNFFDFVNIDKIYTDYTANVSGGLNIIREDLNDLDFNLVEAGKQKIIFIIDKSNDHVMTIGSVYKNGINTIKQGGLNYANVFSSNLVNNLGVIDRQLHTAKTNFCK